MKLTTAQNDRAAGVLLALACGDALGAGYEFGEPLDDDAPVTMKGGGGFGWAPGEWTDDTPMAIPIARAASRGDRFDDPAALDHIVAEWADWARTATDVGIQARRVLSTMTAPTEAAATDAARAVHGSSSLLRFRMPVRRSSCWRRVAAG